jgi:hypothetical protein
VGRWKEIEIGSGNAEVGNKKMGNWMLIDGALCKAGHDSTELAEILAGLDPAATVGCPTRDS